MQKESVEYRSQTLDPNLKAHPMIFRWLQGVQEGEGGEAVALELHIFRERGGWGAGSGCVFVVRNM